MIDILWYGYLGFLAISSIVILVTGGFRRILGRIDFVFSIITWIGLFGYVSDQQFLTPLVWKIVFIVGLLWDIIVSFIKYNEETNYDDEPRFVKLIIFVISLLLLIGPLYFGLFHYAFQ